MRTFLAIAQTALIVALIGPATATAGLTTLHGVRGSIETRYTKGLTKATSSTSSRNGDLLVMAGLVLQR